MKEEKGNGTCRNNTLPVRHEGLLSLQHLLQVLYNSLLEILNNIKISSYITLFC